MKRIYVIIAACLISAPVFAQTDSTRKDTSRTSQTDTIRIGGMIIIKKDSPNQKRGKTIVVTGNRKQKHSNISTANFIIDLGFANWIDETDYASATSQNYLINRPGSPAIEPTDFKLKTGKSTNVNIWVFMQRLNLIKHYVNLKYGIGVELNNYRFKSNISFKEGGTNNPYNSSQNIGHAFVFRDSISFSKNKLSADYVTVPFMLNFRTNPNYSDKGLSFSAGMSMGYLYNSRNKQISGERGKLKRKGDYDLEKWKLSYIGELGLGPLRLYGSYSPNSIFENGLNITPYNIGIRLSNW